MSTTFSRAVLLTTIMLAGCASNPDIPTYSGEVRAAVSEKVTEASTFVRNELSPPMPAWDTAPQPVGSASAATVKHNADARGRPGQAMAPAAPAQTTASGVEVYSIVSGHLTTSIQRHSLLG